MFESKTDWKKTQLGFEPLEQRQLLAAEFLEACFASQFAAETKVEPVAVYGPQQLFSESAEASVAESAEEVPSVSIADASVVESNSGTQSLTFELTLSEASAVAVEVDVATVSGTAESILVERIATGLSSPVFVTDAPGDADSLFIVEQGGVIRKMSLASGAVASTPFLTVSGISTGGERGLLGLAFHPEYETNGRFYVYVTDSNRDSLIREYTANPGGETADPNSVRNILGFDQPFGNHNAGWMDFGPDGYLYIASGDGGSGNDPGDNAQDLTNNLLGKMLRIDVDGDDFTAADRNYAIPPSNPFVGATGDDEIWAYGLRNPWRNSFDRETGDLWVADVGQNILEEINFQPASSSGGENYGWRDREGTVATPNVGGPKPPGAIDPIYEYQHGGGTTQGGSVTGGYVYRGPILELQGQYFFADFVSERIWSLRSNGVDPSSFDGTNHADFTDWTDLLTPETGSINDISSFGEDSDGNLYIVDLGGEIFRITQGADYLGTRESVRFEPGITTRTVSVDVIGDRLPENTEQFSVVLSNPSGAIIGDGTAIGSISNDDAPQVVDVTINGGAVQRSMVDQIAVTFDSVVELDLESGSPFQVTNRDTMENVNLVPNVSNATGRTIVTLQFAGGPSVETLANGAPTLADGNYQLNVIASRVSIGDIALDGNADGSPGDDFQFGTAAADSFFRHFGDTDGDRDVDGQDYGRFGLAFLKSIGQDGYDRALDFDGDGDIDGQDYGQFGLRFLGSLNF